jgi:hypothetical protein
MRRFRKPAIPLLAKPAASGEKINISRYWSEKSRARRASSK